MNTNEIIDIKEMKAHSMERVGALERVKNVSYIPGTEYATTALVAEYYEVTIEAIRKIVSRNKELLKKDGLKTLKGEEIIPMIPYHVSIIRGSGYYEIENVKIAYNANTLFPRRTILRVGMLLQNSNVAKNVRTQILTVAGEREEESKKNAIINEERRLALNVGKAIMDGNAEEASKAFHELTVFKEICNSKLVL